MSASIFNPVCGGSGTVSAIPANWYLKTGHSHQCHCVHAPVGLNLELEQPAGPQPLIVPQLLHHWVGLACRMINSNYL
ncbi:hypothetical protein AB0758_43790 [Tolypothrix bouteillei VB521301_2]|uniref:hypothetical protein n=1 Tax=Tolypothrix bouteillei TaxID=1246981 RepID=UPI0038B5D2E9